MQASVSVVCSVILVVLVVAQKVVDNGKVLVTQAASLQRTIRLMGNASQRDRSVRSGRNSRSQP